MIPQLNGGILIDKPAGLTSHDVVARLRYILQNKRIGHTGTLDPFATGLMVICLGTATRLSQFLTGKDKSYRATARFGFATDTQDYTGLPASEVRSTQFLTDELLRETALGMIGPQHQIPPMYSAKKVEGIALHRLARQGQVVFRAEVPVKILSLEFIPDSEGRLPRRNEDGTTDADFTVSCSAGTYIRTLAHDLGERLGCGAHLTALRRTEVGRFSIDDALTMERVVEHVARGTIPQVLLSPADLLGDWVRVEVSPENHARFCHGQTIRVHIPESSAAFFRQNGDPLVAVGDRQGNLIGVAGYDAASGNARPQVVFND